ncbi:hypothetical protein [Chlamydiifrater volucris]|uniref:hypothetical protein n=1 Tax=Chlamydiifrater volucris TaxID=2681470 RepID=UPI001BD00825|nr:hypothetical protein [Chlamydiifrater volucris]
MKNFYCLIAILLAPLTFNTSLGSEECLITMTAKEQNMFRRSLQSLLDMALEDGAVFLSTLNQLEKQPTKHAHSTFNECYENILEVAKNMETLCSLDAQIKEGSAWNVIAEIAEEQLLVDEFMNEEEILSYMKQIRCLKEKETAGQAIIKMARENYLDLGEENTVLTMVSETAEAAIDEGNVNLAEEEDFLFEKEEEIVLTTNVLAVNSSDL